MKQPVSRRTHDLRDQFLGVFLQEGAPLLDAVWNEAVALQWDRLRDAVRDAGLEGTRGDTLRIEPVQDGTSLVNLRIRGGADRFYCDGIPVLWPRDVLIDEQSCCCHEGLIEQLAADVDYTITLRTWVEYVDADDLPDLDEPFLRGERGSFRAHVRSCVEIGAGTPAPMSEPNLGLTVFADYNGNENVLYHLEIAGHDGDRLALLWDDHNGSTVTRVTAAADRFATTLHLADTTGFAAGDVVRLESEDGPLGIYQVAEVEADALRIRRFLDREPISVAARTVRSHVFFPDLVPMRLTVVFDGEATFPVGALIGDLAIDLPDYPNELWQVVTVQTEPASGCIAVDLAPYFGLEAAIDPWGESSALRREAVSHGLCVLVDERACWPVGARVRITATPFAAEPPPCCGKSASRPDAEAGDCPPDNRGQRREELRHIAAIERCGEHVKCGEDRHPVMTLRLSDPLESDHLKCHDFVQLERPLRARRFAGYATDVPVYPAAACEDHSASLCCPLSSLGLPSGLQLAITRPADAATSAEAGRGWHFAARVGGWYERRLFAPVDPVARGLTPLATLRLDGDFGYTLTDVRPVPAPHSLRGPLAHIQLAAEELAMACPDAKVRALAQQIAMLAALPRVQGPRGPDRPGLLAAIDLLAALYLDAKDQPPQLTAQRLYLRALVKYLAALPELGELDLLRLARAIERLGRACAAGKAEPPKPAEPPIEPKPPIQPKPPAPPKPPIEPKPPILPGPPIPPIGEPQPPILPGQPLPPIEPQPPILPGQPLPPIEPQPPILPGQPIPPIEPQPPILPGQPIPPIEPQPPILPGQPLPPIEPQPPILPGQPIPPIEPQPPILPGQPIPPIEPNPPILPGQPIPPIGDPLDPEPPILPGVPHPKLQPWQPLPPIQPVLSDLSLAPAARTIAALPVIPHLLPDLAALPQPPPVRLFDLPSHALLAVQRIPVRSRARIIDQSPTLGELLGAPPSTSKVTVALRRELERFVAQLMVAAHRPGPALQTLWSLNVEAGYPAPTAAQLAADLAGGEEDPS